MSDKSCAFELETGYYAVAGIWLIILGVFVWLVYQASPRKAQFALNRSICFNRCQLDTRRDLYQKDEGGNETHS